MRGIHHHISYLILNYEIEFFVRLYLRTSPQPPFKCIGLAVGSLGYKYNKGEHLKGGRGEVQHRDLTANPIQKILFRNSRFLDIIIIKLCALKQKKFICILTVMPFNA